MYLLAYKTIKTYFTHKTVSFFQMLYFCDFFFYDRWGAVNSFKIPRQTSEFTCICLGK